MVVKEQFPFRSAASIPEFDSRILDRSRSRAGGSIGVDPSLRLSSFTQPALRIFSILPASLLLGSSHSS